MRWFTLGFTSEMVVGSWQDTRFAYECRTAWDKAGRPACFRVLAGAGEGEHVAFWYVDEATAAVLDGQNVAWRKFLVGERAPPADALTAVLLDDPPK